MGDVKNEGVKFGWGLGEIKWSGEELNEVD